MKKNGITVIDALKKFGTKRMIAAMMSMVFFVGLIIGYFLDMYSTEKKNIMFQGELNAVQSMELFNNYISTATNIVKTARYTVDKMLDNGDSKQEILDFMMENTENIQKSIDDRFTGLYGFIKGEYYDGAGWVPDEDYVPTERPWYKKAVTNKGRITIIEPYLDAQTGNLMTTVVQTLKDGRSVVAIDISFDMVQMMSGSDTTPIDNTMGFIMDKNGIVLVNNITEEIGHNYRTENDTLGAAVVTELFANTEECFEISFHGTTYVVYSVKINEEWYSVSVIDATESYQPLRNMLIITIILILIAIVILSVVFASMIVRNLTSDRLNEQLSASADIYLAVLDIDVVNNNYLSIRKNHDVKDAIKTSVGAQELLEQVASHIAHEDSRDLLMQFVKLDTLLGRLGGSNTITTEFHSYRGIWCRARFVVSKYTHEGRLSHVLWMVESIDEEKKRRDMLQDISIKALAESEAKSEFLSNMSHEIRTPINAVMGMNEMILRESTDDNILTYSESIQTAGETLLGLVNEILDLSKIEAGRMELIIVEYDLSSLLNDLVNMIQPRMDSKDLLFVIDFDRSIPNTLRGDEIRVRQIITNILTNAAKYTNEGKVTFRVGYEKLIGSDDIIQLNISVEDTGIGIKEEDMANLFSQYVRIDEERNRNVEGTGLGMPITQKLLNMMGSNLEVESEYGKGSVFSFSLRQEVVKWDPVGDYESSYRRNMARRKKYRASFTAPEVNILVVDDTKMNLMVFKSLLKQTKVHIDTAASGDEGIELVAKNKYDIIFLDHMMPNKDGIQTLKEMRELDDYLSKEAPVICLTANAISGAREKYIRAGFDDYLTKPIDSVKLEKMMMKYLPSEKIIKNEENGVT